MGIPWKTKKKSTKATKKQQIAGKKKNRKSLQKEKEKTKNSIKGVVNLFQLMHCFCPFPKSEICKVLWRVFSYLVLKIWSRSIYNLQNKGGAIWFFANYEGIFDIISLRQWYKLRIFYSSIYYVREYFRYVVVVSPI